MKQVAFSLSDSSSDLLSFPFGARQTDAPVVPMKSREELLREVQLTVDGPPRFELMGPPRSLHHDAIALPLPGSRSLTPPQRAPFAMPKAVPMDASARWRAVRQADVQKLMMIFEPSSESAKAFISGHVVLDAQADNTTNGALKRKSIADKTTSIAQSKTAASSKSNRWQRESGDTVRKVNDEESLASEASSNSNSAVYDVRQSVEELLAVRESRESVFQRKKRKWREIVHLFVVSRDPAYANKSIEKALLLHETGLMTQQNFVMTIMGEYKFANDLQMDGHLKRLYSSLDNAQKSQADLREVVAAMKCLLFYRTVRLNPIELLAMVFDIFADCKYSDALATQRHRELGTNKTISATNTNKNGNSNASSSSTRSGSSPGRITSAKLSTALVPAKDIRGSRETVANNNSLDEFKGKFENTNWFLRTEADLQCILFLPVVTTTEYATMQGLIDDALALEPKMKILRKLDFLVFLDSHDAILKYWSKLVWSRVPSQFRLQVLDEIEAATFEDQEQKLYFIQYNTAVRFNNLSIMKHTWMQWRRGIGDVVLIYRNLNRVLYRKTRIFITFWLDYATKRRMKRRRAILAEVMGAYTIKARCFARMRLLVYSMKRIKIAASRSEEYVKRVGQGLFRLREAQRLYILRRFICKWADIVAWENINDLATHMQNRHFTTRVFKAWAKLAMENAELKRNEIMAAKNQMELFQMMAEADRDVVALQALESKIKAERSAEREAQLKAEAKARADEIAADIRAQKEAKSRILMSVQVNTQRSVEYVKIKRLKRKFRKDWEKRMRDGLRDANMRAERFLQSEEAKPTLRARFKKLKADALAAPSPENMEREKRMADRKNILLLWLQERMDAQNMSLSMLFYGFDDSSKGYLTHDEFRKMVAELEINIPDTFVTDLIEAVDRKNENIISVQAIEKSMEDLKYLGVEGSNWKHYIDPAQNVFVYHNLREDRKYLDYQITDPIYMEINRDNFVAEFIASTKKELMDAQKAEWEQVVLHISAMRLQNMARRWLARRKRRRELWKVDNKIAFENNKKKQKVYLFISRRIALHRSRELFKRQLWCTIEKVWDIQRKRIFWHNHMNHESSWEKPKLLKRYGDVENPSVWQAMEVANSKTGQKEVNFWHVTAERQITRKPDGFSICGSCHFNIATRRCIDCEFDYCFSCFRATHQSPFGFFQKETTITASDRENRAFLTCLQCCGHKWGPVLAKRCDLCSSSATTTTASGKATNAGTSSAHTAALHCDNCNKNFCRRCHRKVHAGDGFKDHVAWLI